MKKLTLLTTLLIGSFSGLVESHAQNLIFDNTFNSGAPYQDSYTTIIPDYDYHSYGRMKRINDTTFVYFINSIDWDNETYISEVRAVISHQDGTASHVTVYGGQSQSFVGGEATDGIITDVATNQSNGHIYIVKNGLFDDNGTTRKCVVVVGQQYDANTISVTPISGWGINSTGIAQISAPGVDMLNAKASVLSGNICLAYTILGPNNDQLAFSRLGFTGAYSGYSVLSSNPAYSYSSVVDIVAVSTNEVYIADNAFSRSNSNGTDYYTANNRIFKVNSSGFLDNTYGGGNGIAPVNWAASSNNVPIIANEIKRILYDGGKLLVAGTTSSFLGTEVAQTWGVVSRFNSDGSVETGFASSGNGTFVSDQTIPDQYSVYFHDIDLSADGSYFISCVGSTGDTKFDPLTSYIIKINSAGIYQSTGGNNGFLFENSTYREISEMIILPGSSTLEDKFVFNGMKIINTNNQTHETAVGKLIWSNSINPSGIEETTQPIINLYPNPVSTQLSIISSGNHQVQLVSVLGEVISTIQLSTGHNNLNVSGLTNGLYFLLSSNGHTEKFIKQ